MQNKCIGFCLSLDKMDHIQGRSDTTSSVAFEVLIINCQTYFIIFFQFQTFDIKFWFSVKVYSKFPTKDIVPARFVFSTARLLTKLYIYYTFMIDNK